MELPIVFIGKSNVDVQSFIALSLLNDSPD